MAKSCRPEHTRRNERWTLALAVALTSVLPLFAGPHREGEKWKFDLVHLRNGKTWPGLVTKETADFITLLPVQRKPGEPTKIGPETSFPRSEVEYVEKLGSEERKLLESRLKERNPATEKQRMAKVKLEPAPWGNDSKGGLCFTSDRFVLKSDAGEDVVRLAAVRLEEIYAAYAQLLPPQIPSAQPTTIFLVRSNDEYQQLVKNQGREFLNPAFFDRASNQIICAAGFTHNWKQVHDKGRELLGRLKRQEEEWRKLYTGTVLAELLQKLNKDRRKISDAEYEDDQILGRSWQRFFATLYHEAFHAYLLKFVYPTSETEVPRWLNEGWAQIFETAVPEAGELRVGRPDPKRLSQAKAAQRAQRKEELAELADLLRAGPKEFLVAHASDQQLSDRYYLTSWALAFYLTFDRKILGTSELDEYVHALKKGADPLEAFEKLVGRSLPQFEKAFHEYIERVQSDGSASPRRGHAPGV